VHGVVVRAGGQQFLAEFGGFGVPAGLLGCFPVLLLLLLACFAAAVDFVPVGGVVEGVGEGLPALVSEAPPDGAEEAMFEQLMGGGGQDRDLPCEGEVLDAFVLVAQAGPVVVGGGAQVADALLEGFGAEAGLAAFGALVEDEEDGWAYDAVVVVAVAGRF
jgi:hypothetical protein